MGVQSNTKLTFDLFEHKPAPQQDQFQGQQKRTLMVHRFVARMTSAFLEGPYWYLFALCSKSRAWWYI